MVDCGRGSESSDGEDRVVRAEECDRGRDEDCVVGDDERGWEGVDDWGRGGAGRDVTQNQSCLELMQSSYVLEIESTLLSHKCQPVENRTDPTKLKLMLLLEELSSSKNL